MLDVVYDAVLVRVVFVAAEQAYADGTRPGSWACRVGWRDAVVG